MVISVPQLVGRDFLLYYILMDLIFMVKNTLIAYDLTNEPDDKNRKAIRKKIEDYCGDSCQLSESCYLFETDETLESIFNELKHVLDETDDRLSVIRISDIRSNTWCGQKTRIGMMLGF